MTGIINADAPATLALRTWILPPRRIGGRLYHGECTIARVRHVTYQQQSTTFGRSAGVLGLSTNGDGFVTGGGGFVDTVHRGVVNVVLEDQNGHHRAEELPAEIAVLEQTIVRLDCIDRNIVAVTNLSGRQSPRLLLGPSAFIQRTKLTKAHGLLLLAALLSAGQMRSNHPLEATGLTLIFGLAPALRLRRMIVEADRRRRLEQYIVEVMS